EEIEGRRIEILGIRCILHFIGRGWRVSEYKSGTAVHGDTFETQRAAIADATLKFEQVGKEKVRATIATYPVLNQ
ncbi:MAG: hypothetical protein ACYCZF_13890, partial [Anaerolineae bacterium]